ncbi:MAG TPA: DUF2085 domain-containing protein [Candidatus Poseidoniales archaeon]|nr:DUF2085 domain-containing protein [Candidatus Poseidoniales archaeon]HIA24779.1 DUF2085 domain-containing protein [Candidatus Poseidoniales archaeon]HIB24590.1 DUF2085 domain-containing protein [Candidatus Poseidoniales archaeon]HIN45573.1 DUF2085 domain-containing protein [Candidatus Poseidoniales archaeon]HIO57275.1 DUF2085 domain-containing protein [Candidatus Poseidoniales archaeon]
MFPHQSSMVSENGLHDRRREINISNWVIGLSLGYLIACFLVPALLPTGSVPELSGRANTLDYVWKDASWGDWGNEPRSENASMGHDQAQHGGKFAWSELDIFSAFVYGFGDLNCHQKHERSWVINENQMPVCTRDIGIFAGIFVGGLIFRKRGLNRWTIRDSIISVLPDEKVEPFYFNDRRFLLAFGGIALLLLPTALDGGIQAVSDYESTNIKRLITGFPMGVGVGLLFAGVFAANPKPFEFDAGRVILPANARLVPSVEPTDDKISEIATQTETDTTAGDSEE